jgi:hypothetical protein
MGRFGLENRGKRTNFLMMADDAILLLIYFMQGSLFV